MTGPVERSYKWCVASARRRARNFYYSFLLLPPAKRRAICAIYAFMRECDDLTDEPGAHRAALTAWRRDLDRALQGEFGPHPCWPALHDTLQRYRIPPRYLHEMIDGVSSDLEPRRLATFEELYRYCYLVASVVGLTVIHIFEFQSAEALPLAEKCGVAFQLTNILRDVAEDNARGRIYLPLEDLDRFGVNPEDLRYDERFQKLMAFEAERARAYYRESLPLVHMVHPDSRASLRALIRIYERLLAKIERARFDVLSQRVRVPAWEKVGILVQSALRRA